MKGLITPHMTKTSTKGLDEGRAYIFPLVLNNTEWLTGRVKDTK